MALVTSQRVSAGFSMSSMTDLVFLLLIFFVIVSTLVSPYALPIDLPKANSSKAEAPKVVVALSANAGIMLNQAPLAEEQLESALKAEMSRHPQEQSIVLRTDQDTPTGATVSVLDIAKRNKWKIILATKPE